MNARDFLQESSWFVPDHRLRTAWTYLGLHRDSVNYRLLKTKWAKIKDGPATLCGVPSVCS